MEKKKVIDGQHFTGERALFRIADTEMIDCIFSDGESPLKESSNLLLINCNFQWRYPLWYCKHVKVLGGVWNADVRAGAWYTEDIAMGHMRTECPKGFRRCRGVKLFNMRMLGADETLWDCRDIELENFTVEGNYFAMNSEDIVIRNATVNGPYSFDGAKNVEIHESRILSKDAFWNSENVTVYDSYIKGEYIGWNARNLTLINCTVESLQGFCYIENLVMKNCRTAHTDLAFEYSTVDIEIIGGIDSIKNPKSGTIRVGHVGELIMESECIDPEKTQITFTEH